MCIYVHMCVYSEQPISKTDYSAIPKEREIQTFYTNKSECTFSFQTKTLFMRFCLLKEQRLCLMCKALFSWQAKYIVESASS